MCGIVGYVPGIRPSPDAEALFVRLWRESLVRGRHAAGLAQPSPTGPNVHRALHLEADLLAQFDYTRPAIAHTRYSTSGDWRTEANNQPIVLGQLALAFNGVIHMGTKAEFEAAFGVTCDTDNDGEVFLRLLAQGEKPEEVLRSLSGSFAGVWLDSGALLAGRNARRPLWRAHALGAHWYASTRDIFRRAGIADVREVTPLRVEVMW